MDRQEIYDQLSHVWSDWPELSLPDKEYWSHPDITVAKIRAKYNLKKWKPEPVPLTIVCPDCGQEDKLVLEYKKDVISRGEKWKCPNKACPGHEVRFPFGKFRGRTVAEVYREQPSYVAWFMEAVDRDSAEVRAVVAEIEKLPGIGEHIAKYQAKQTQQHLGEYQGKQFQQPWTGHIRLSGGSLDDLCDRLFNGE